MNIFSLSFGKDSMATLILAAEQGIPIDRVMYCEIKFNDEISGEHPIMAAWIPEAERILKERFGITVEHAFSKTYLEAFYTVKETGRFSGNIYGFPYIRGAWCNRILKLNAISKYLSQFKKQAITQFVGIACDEPRRWGRMKAKENSRKKYRSLLVEQNLTEQDAFEICKKYDLLSPMYSVDGIYRSGCWFCPKQCLANLYSLWKNYPDYFQKLVDIENDSRIITKFKPDGNPSDYAKRFESGYVPVRKKQRAMEKQISIDEYLEELNER